ncbi:MAG: hypothetical protein AB7E52_01520 [Bdellovibrionales bacterium]
MYSKKGWPKSRNYYVDAPLLKRLFEPRFDLIKLGSMPSGKDDPYRMHFIIARAFFEKVDAFSIVG